MKENTAHAHVLMSSSYSRRYFEEGKARVLRMVEFEKKNCIEPRQGTQEALSPLLRLSVMEKCIVQ